MFFSSLLNRLSSFRTSLKICSSNISTLRRALLYVPGSDERKLTKALNTSFDIDCLCMDCEDGVALNQKEQARRTIATILDKGKPEKNRDYDLAVRLNSIDSTLFENDLSAVLNCKTLPDTLMLPKVESPEHVKYFLECGNKHLKSGQKLRLVMFIESALAFVNLTSTCRILQDRTSQPSSKIIPEALVFGSDDFCASIGASRTEDSNEVSYARQKLVLVAKAFNLQAIDMVYINYKDLEGLRRQSLAGAAMGYTGKQVIHPGQIQTVQSAFLPSKKAQEWAAGLLSAFAEHQKIGKGAFTYEGQMIDMPTVKQAQNIIKAVNSAKV